MGSSLERDKSKEKDKEGDSLTKAAAMLAMRHNSKSKSPHRDKTVGFLEDGNDSKPTHETNHNGSKMSSRKADDDTMKITSDDSSKDLLSNRWKHPGKWKVIAKW